MKNWAEAGLCSVAAQTWSESIICHDTKAFKRADAGIQVQEQDDFYSVQEQIAKIVTKKLPLPSVLANVFLFCSSINWFF